MANQKYTYARTSFPNESVNLDRLTKEIQDSEITTALNSISSWQDVVEIEFKATLSTGDEDILDGIVAEHPGTPLPSSNQPSLVSLVTTDPLTKSVQVTRKFAEDGAIQRLHEVEFWTSKAPLAEPPALKPWQGNLGHVHDYDYMMNTYGWSSVKYYSSEMVEGSIVDTELVNPTQAQLDASCTRTDLIFHPNIDYWVLSGTIAHDVVPAEDIYMWALFLDLDQAAGGPVLEIVSGGLNLKCVDAKKPVGIKGVSPSKVFKDGVVDESGAFNSIPEGMGSNRIRYVFRHPPGFQCKLQTILEIFRKGF